MKLSEINKQINKKWVKPTKDNIKVGNLIRYFRSLDRRDGAYRYCKIASIDGDGFWGYFTYDIKKVNENGRKRFLNNKDIEEVLV
jgi:hypothetical protein